VSELIGSKLAKQDLSGFAKYYKYNPTKSKQQQRKKLINLSNGLL